MLRFISFLFATILGVVAPAALAEDGLAEKPDFEVVFDTAFVEICPQALAQKGALLRDEEAIAKWGYRTVLDGGNTLIIERDDFQIAYVYDDDRCDLSYPSDNPEAKAKFVDRWTKYVARTHKSVNLAKILESDRWVPEAVVITDAVPGKKVWLLMGYLAERKAIEIPEMHMISLQLVED